MPSLKETCSLTCSDELHRVSITDVGDLVLHDHPRNSVTQCHIWNAISALEGVERPFCFDLLDAWKRCLLPTEHPRYADLLAVQLLPQSFLAILGAARGRSNIRGICASQNISDIFSLFLKNFMSCSYNVGFHITTHLQQLYEGHSYISGFSMDRGNTCHLDIGFYPLWHESVYLKGKAIIDRHFVTCYFDSKNIMAVRQVIFPDRSHTLYVDQCYEENGRLIWKKPARRPHDRSVAPY